VLDTFDFDFNKKMNRALVYDLAKEFPGVPPARLFEAIYLALVGRKRGPRAGAFIAFVGTEFAKKRFIDAAQAS